jgi:2-succinyl-5-enolpyruvyl-6-hydroxy-3-cyclohexene-1-carboxylate synthase
MARNSTKTKNNPTTGSPLMNALLAHHVLQTLIDQGVRECCICPGARNAPLIYLLVNQSLIKLYYWPEERSAAFFALGRIKATQHPVAVITTSGTAAGELLPAAMEAYYANFPLILVTADRPRRFRGVGAPQAAEQVGLFGIYAHYSQDLAAEEFCDLTRWTKQGAAHLNICFEEPQAEDCLTALGSFTTEQPLVKQNPLPHSYADRSFEKFMKGVSCPLVLVGALASHQQENVVQFLLHLQAPVYAEAISGIREDPRLDSLIIAYIDKLWKQSSDYHYVIDGVIRVGGIPTARLWRDLENQEGDIPVCSISESSFTGLSWGTVIQTNLNQFFRELNQCFVPHVYPFHAWFQANQQSYQRFLALLESEPQSEMSLVHQLSQLIPTHSKVYLGNSLPIREWDQAATYQQRHFQLAANRGLNGIDGQLATFLGYCTKEQSNWALIGDLTALFDLVAPWILPQLTAIEANCVIINNGGGKIFAPMFSHPAFQNLHSIHFESLARLWDWSYERWEAVPTSISHQKQGRFIEMIPNEEATQRVLKKIKE